jgi:FkbM family methyltransferase
VLAILSRVRGLRSEEPDLLATHPDAELRPRLDHVVAHRLISGEPDLFVVQVGAFDGSSGDPIYDWMRRFGWRGILTEPQPYYFGKLQAAYADCPGVVLRNVAIASRTGKRSLYYVSGDDPGDPEWVGQLASFSRSTILSHEDAVPNLEQRIDSHEVDCLTFEDLLSGVTRVDLLQIDAEGYDAEVVRLFDFDRWRPSIVNFEHKHLPRDEHESAMRRLISYGYRIARTGDDTIGYAPQYAGTFSLRSDAESPVRLDEAGDP